MGEGRAARTVARWALPFLLGAAASAIVAVRGREGRTRPAAPRTDPSELLDVMVHELRTPIASIRSLSRELTCGTSRLDADGRQEALALVQAHTNHLAAMLDDIRDLGMRLRHDPTVALDPGAITRLGPDVGTRWGATHLETLLHAAADAAAVPPSQVSFQVEAAVADVETDPVLLRRIATNLLENAHRHGPVRGAVAVTAARRDGDVVLTFLGSDPAAHVDAATPQLPPTTSGDPGGGRSGRASGGLGLRVVERLVASLDGTVRVERHRGAVGVEVVLHSPGDRAR